MYFQHYNPNIYKSPVKHMLKLVKEEYNLEVQKFPNTENMPWAFARNALGRISNWEVTFEKEMMSKTHSNVTQEDISVCFGRIDCFDTLGEIFDFLLNLFEEANLKDISMAQDLLFAILATVGKQRKITDVYMYIRNCTSCFVLNCVSNVLTFRNFNELFTVPYAVLKTSVSYVFDRGDSILLVWPIILSRVEHLLSHVLRYGGIFLPFKTGPMDWYTCDKAVQYLLFYRHNCQIAPVPNIYLQISILYCSGAISLSPRFFTVMKGLQIFYLELKSKDEVLGRVRRQEMEAGSSRSIILDPDTPQYIPQYFPSLRLVFDAIPEPFISSNEIKYTLTEACRIYWNHRTEAYISELILEYEILYPEGAGPPIPRSLKHLSRCKIREILRELRRLPFGVYRLPFGVYDLERKELEKLENYILLKE